MDPLSYSTEDTASVSLNPPHDGWALPPTPPPTPACWYVACPCYLQEHLYPLGGFNPKDCQVGGSNQTG